MSRDPIRSPNRDFLKSPNRDRISDPRLVPGCLRFMIGGPSSAVRVQGLPMSPTPPPGYPVNDRELEGTGGGMLMPADYPGLFIPSPSPVNDGFFNFAIGSSTPFTDAAIRPDLISGVFKFKVRCWGVVPLCDPFTIPSVSYTLPAPSSTTVYNGNSRLGIKYPHLLENSYALAPPQRTLVLNAVAAEPGMPEPFGLWHIDRIVTGYGQYRPDSGEAGLCRLGWLDSAPSIGPMAWVYRDFRFGVERIIAGQMQEPNYTLFNPVNPTPIELGPFPNPQDDGITVFGTRTNVFKWGQIAFCATLFPIEPVAQAGDMEIEILTQEQVSSVRDLLP